DAEPQARGAARWADLGRERTRGGQHLLVYAARPGGPELVGPVAVHQRGQVLREPIHRPLERVDPIHDAREAVALVRVLVVLVRRTVLLERRDDLERLALRHAWVVRALQ